MYRRPTSGFTIVEVVVALTIVALFATFFIQMFLTTESQRVAMLRRSTASDIAYSNLRKFTAKPALTCTAAMDLSLSSSAPGTTVSFTAETAPAILGTGTTQTIRAFAPNGCSVYGSNPVKLVSEVTYGASEKVVHAAYVN